MKADKIELVGQPPRVQGETRWIAEQRPTAAPERQTAHYTELAEDTSGGPIAQEWNVYRREVGRLLAEGNEGKWLIIKGDDIVGIWDTEKEADQVRLQRFFRQDLLLKQILSREPVLRGGGYCRRWRNYPSQSYLRVGSEANHGFTALG